jgi:hypothetical protein
MGRVMKRGVLQNTGPCLQAHYSSLGPECMYNMADGLKFDAAACFDKAYTIQRDRSD